MYTVSIRISGLKCKNITCSSPEEAQKCANLYWHRDPVIVDNRTGRLVPVQLSLEGVAESEY